MQTVTRRDFLGATALTGIGVLTADGAWALNKLEPLSDTLNQEYPYRAWEDLYRDEFTWDHVGYAAHCINCVGNCAFRIYAKDGIVLREEQLAEYPQINPDTPDANPRGCQKGAIHSAAMYEGDRLRYPMKRAGERGEGKWQRISWDQATTEIADKIIDISGVGRRRLDRRGHRHRRGPARGMGGSGRHRVRGRGRRHGGAQAPAVIGRFDESPTARRIHE